MSLQSYFTAAQNPVARAEFRHQRYVLEREERGPGDDGRVPLRDDEPVVAEPPGGTPPGPPLVPEPGG